MSRVKTHLGAAVMPDEPSRRINVIVELIAGYIIIRDSAGKKLRIWQSGEVTAELSEGSRLLLTLGKERVLLDTVDPVGFTKSLETENRYIREMALSDRMNQAARMGTVHFGKGPDEFDSPAEPEADTPVTSSLAIDSDTEAEQVPLEEADFGEPEQPDSPLGLLEAVQPSVVDSIQFGMKSWFGFYFLTGEGTGQERLNAAIEGLREASSRLRDASDCLGSAVDLDQTEGQFADTYRRAVDGWAAAMNSIARGIELDQRQLADDGFALLADASGTAKRVVRSPVYPNLAPTHAGATRGPLASESLAYLARLSPAGKAAKSAVRRAKQPWERALIAAGSPFRRP